MPYLPATVAIACEMLLTILTDIVMMRYLRKRELQVEIRKDQFEGLTERGVEVYVGIEEG
jgi:hypothetical protein